MTILTASEVADRLRLTTRTVTIYAAEGRFPGAFKAGPRWRFPESALAAYIERQTPTPRGGLTPRDARSESARRSAATRKRRTP